MQNINIENICRYLEEGSTEKQRVGVELEHFICREDLTPISYEELSGIMTRIAEASGGTPVFEGEHIIGIAYKDYGISLEPAGQVEISIFPFEQIASVEKVYDEFTSVWEPELKKAGCHFERCGVFPLVENGEYDSSMMPLLPKKRYAIMDQYFSEMGGLGPYMMRCSASTQISIDYSSMEDAFRKIRILEKISPLLQLLMENQCGGGLGRRWDKPHLLRTQIWNGVDPDRCGYIPGLLEPGYCFADYARLLVSKPLVVQKENGQLSAAGKKTAAQLGEVKPSDVPHVLSMFFFHIRLKNYIELRVADSVPKNRMLGYGALLKELLYAPGKLARLENMFSSVTTEEEIIAAEHALMEEGYGAFVYGKEAVQWLTELYELAAEGAEAEDQTYLSHILTLPMLEAIYRNSLNHDLQEHAKSAEAMQNYISQSSAKYHNRVVRTLYLPKLFRTAEVARFSGIIETLYGIVSKVMKQYFEDAEYRKLFGFSSDLEKLILRDPGYSHDIPIARVDLFYDEQTKNYQFCEFNTDGTSAMNEDRELNIGLKLSYAHRIFEKQYSVAAFELFDSWVEAFLENYREFAAKKNRGDVPGVAIVDFMDRATVNEFYVFKDAFERKHIPCEVCDIRELSWNGSVCRTKSGMKVDAVYRRAVTSDIMERFSEVPDFIEGLKRDAFCLMGDFKTEIMHNKVLFKILHQEATLRFLTKSEQRFIRAHVPYTLALEEAAFADEELKRSVFGEKDRWIIKPENSYGSRGVHAGVECTEEEWAELVRANMDTCYILQRFCVPYRLKNTDLRFKGGNPSWRDTSNLTGIFVYNGKLAGLYSRVSYDSMISTQYNEMTVPTVVVEERK